MAKLVGRVKLAAELGSGIMSKTEVAPIDRDDFVVAEAACLSLVPIARPRYRMLAPPTWG